jgi:ABC-type protease/lipase transport system fused ATPase/permease subunit
MLKQVRRAVLAAFMFSGFVNVLMMASPLYTLQVFETVVPTGSIEKLVLLTLMAAAAIAVLMLVELVRDTILLRTGLWLDHMLGQYVLENGLKLGRSPADMRADDQALTQLKQFLTSSAITALLDAPWLPFFLVALVLIHPMIGGVAIVASLLLVIGALAQILVTGRAQHESTQANEAADQWWQTVTRSTQLAGALGLTRGATEQWEAYNRAHVASSYSLGKRTGFIKALARTIRIGAQLAVYGIGAWLVVRAELAPGALVASAILLGRALAPLESAVSSLKAAQASIRAYRRLKALPADAAVPKLLETDSAALGRLVLSDVTHYHPTRKTPALRSVGLSLDPGECLGIVGPNGAGKSTLAAVIAGAVMPTAGSADLDGVAVAKWQRGDNPPPVGYLPDDPLLIDGSVYENIARFREASLVGVAQTAMRAGVHETLCGLQSGYDTLVGVNGGALSLRERR